MLGKSQSRSLSHDPLDLSDNVFTNVHIAGLCKANGEVLRQDTEKFFLKFTG
jgi:hypothetical protein